VRVPPALLDLDAKDVLAFAAPPGRASGGAIHAGERGEPLGHGRLTGAF
jgi:hypothetical protein